MKFKGFFVIRPHQGKERAFEEALFTRGYRKSSTSRVVKFALYDLDSGKGGYGWSDTIREFAKRGIPLFLYPHAARPMVQYDGIIEVHPKVRCMFTHTEGGREVMRRFGFDIPIEAVGWSFCKTKPFTPVPQVKSVVFGPIHPNQNGYLSDLDKNLNKWTFEKIHSWCVWSGAQLLVRHLHSLEENGIPFADGVTYFRGSANQSTADIDQADLVIGHQTFAYLAVARGKPTLMMGEDTPPRSGNADTNFRFVKHWDAYRDLLMYPLDILQATDTPGLDAMITRAASTDEDIREWRERFIGKPFDGKLFVDRLEKYL